MYYMIETSEDGTTVRERTREDIQDYLDACERDEYYPPFLTEVPRNPDTGYWDENAVLIIEGQIKVLTPEKVVTKYTLE